MNIISKYIKVLFLHASTGIKLLSFSEKLIFIAWLCFSVVAFTTISFVMSQDVNVFYKKNISLSSNEIPVSSPLEISFSQPLEKMPDIDIKPKIDSYIIYKKTFFGAIKEVKVLPKQGKLLNDQGYELNIKNIKKISGQKSKDVKLALKTEAGPGISSLAPKNDSVNILSDSKISIKLNHKNNGLRHLRPIVTPDIKLSEIRSEDDITFEWKPISPLAQDQQYVVSWYDDNNSSKDPLIMTKFRTVSEPQILNATKTDYFYPGDNLDVTFDQDMNQNSKPVHCNKCNDAGTWISPRIFRIIPQGLQPNVKYEYIISAGTQSALGGKIINDKNNYVKTPGNVYATFDKFIAKDAPLNTSARITFDQPIIKEDVEQLMHIEPSVDHNFEWINNKQVVVHLLNLKNQTTYHIYVMSGIKPQNFGLASSKEFGINITTELRQVKLNVPLYRQQHMSSCEAAALRMALAYRGIVANDLEIVQRFGYNPRPIDRASNSWDDPNEMYVGDIDKSQTSLGGYGAYATAIAKGAKTFGINASVHYGINAAFIADQIYNNNPVVIIGTWGKPRYVSWNGPHGIVHAWYGEHARTVVGVKGNPDRPIGFYINDPLQNKVVYWSASQLENDINAIAQIPNQVVVIH